MTARRSPAELRLLGKRAAVIVAARGVRQGALRVDDAGVTISHAAWTALVRDFDAYNTALAEHIAEKGTADHD